MKSRKARLLLSIIVLATLGSFIPPLVCWLMAIITKHPVAPLVILTDSDWITVISIIVPAYMGSVVWEKHIAINAGVQSGQLNNVVSQINNSPSIPIVPQVSPVNPPAQQQVSDAEREALQEALTHER